MDHLNWELSVLSRAVAYSNLSGASSHVGISQPQLSRIVAKIEAQLNLNLLDRSAKRKSAWTPGAHRLAEIYSATLSRFQGEIQKITQGQEITHVHVGTLEGLIPIALRFIQHLFDNSSAKILELHVEDLNDLEEIFFKGGLDFILTYREPGRKKFRHLRKLGYQTLDATEKAGKTQVMSSFEFGGKVHGLKVAPGTHVLVSNSLEVRKTWLSTLGGSGILPSEVRKTKTGKAGEIPTLLIGSDELPAAFWEKFSAFKF